MGPHILLVEDDEHKRTQVLEFLQRTWANMTVDTAASFQAGMRLLKDRQFTFVILDMTLPNYDIGPEEDGGELRQLGGQEFLRRMKRGQLLIPTVIVTQYESFGSGRDRVDLANLRQTLEERYGTFCKGVIYYNSSIDSWKHELKESIDAAHGKEADG